MTPLTFYYRHTNPVFFSIERVFGNIAAAIQRQYPGVFTIEEVKMPLLSSPRTLWQNMVFTRRYQAGKAGMAINHITGDIHYAILGCSRKKINVLTIHDCVSVQKYSRTDPRYWIIKWVWFSWPVRKATHITVISENTKKELMALTGVRAEKITVIGNFIDPQFQLVDRSFERRCPRILFIGTTENKNLARLAEAMEGMEVLLDIVGELTDVQREELEKRNIRYETASRLSQEALLKKYADCDMLAFPSTYEGFGLPIVEAQAVGRPVLTSDLSPMREVAGSGACLVDPYDPVSIRKGLQRIIEEEEYRKGLIEEGRKNMTGYSLSGVTSAYVALYENLISKRK